MAYYQTWNRMECERFVSQNKCNGAGVRTIKRCLSQVKASDKTEIFGFASISISSFRPLHRKCSKNANSLNQNISTGIAFDRFLCSLSNLQFLAMKMSNYNNKQLQSKILMHFIWDYWFECSFSFPILTQYFDWIENGIRILFTICSFKTTNECLQI